jgi:NAD(P)-dependent dehydrogenase (short-subunit alcohol dehydrogenase family)
MELENKVCVITGAASGIGQRAAKHFASEGAAAAVVDVLEDAGKATVEDIAAKGGKARFYKCDVRNVAQIGETVAAIRKDFGKIDALLNIAGVSRRATPDQLSEEDWDFVLDINLKGAFFMAQACYRVMLEQGYGKILNLGSPRGLATDTTHVAYDASKGGLHAITRSFAVAGGPKGITANTVAPGYVMTDMTRHNLENKDWYDYFKRRNPMGEFIDPQELANVLAFHVSDKVKNVNGNLFIIDGGKLITE